MTQFFIALILYESAAASAADQLLYEECFTLIAAQTEEEARQKAEAHARAQETRYHNGLGETITQTFKQIVDVAPLLYPSFTDGMDLYARHFRNYSAYQAFEPLLGGKPL